MFRLEMELVTWISSNFIFFLEEFLTSCTAQLFFGLEERAVKKAQESLIAVLISCSMLPLANKNSN